MTTNAKNKKEDENKQIETIFKEYRNEVLKEKLFKKITKEIKYKFEIDNSIYKQLITKKGDTQAGEKKYIIIITEILDKMNIAYIRAGSQQPHDFREVGSNIGIHGLNIEGKMTGSYTVKCNDTCPSKDCYYIIILTKHNKILHMNGLDLLGGCEWVYEYLQEVNILKQKYKKNNDIRGNIVTVYPRPSIDVNIKQFI